MNPVGLAAALAVLAASGLAIRLAITRHGPFLLTVLDRLSAGARGVRVLARARLGVAAEQQLIVWGKTTRGAAGSQADGPLPVLVFVHGGSWRSGRAREYGFIARAFAPEGFLVVLAGYRLGREGRYPAMLEDLAAALRWVGENAGRLGGDPARIVVLGHSAGAYNAVMTALDQRWLERAGVSPASIAGVVGLSGPYDFLPLKSDATRAAFGEATDLPATQPINHARKGAPPILLIHGEQDELVGAHNSAHLARALSAAGARAELVTYPAMAHNDPLIALAAPWRWRRELAARIARFARTHTATDPAGDTVSVPVQAKSR